METEAPKRPRKGSSMEGNTMTAFLSTLSLIVTQMFTWVGSVGNAIIADPILTFSLGVFAVGEE